MCTLDGNVFTESLYTRQSTVDMEGIVCVDVGWINLVQDKSDWRSVTSTAKSI
jgi:hypothetical protein